MIIPLTKPESINDLLPLVLATGDTTYSPHGYLNYIKKAIVTDYALCLVNITDDNVIDAMAFCETIVSITDRETMLNFAYVDKEEPEVGMEMWDLIVKWSLDKGSKRICCITDRLKAKAMTRKYGFSQNWVYLTKEIGGSHEG